MHDKVCYFALTHSVPNEIQFKDTAPVAHLNWWCVNHTMTFLHSLPVHYFDGI